MGYSRRSQAVALFVQLILFQRSLRTIAHASLLQPIQSTPRLDSLDPEDFPQIALPLHHSLQITLSIMPVPMLITFSFQIS